MVQHEHDVFAATFKFFHKTKVEVHLFLVEFGVRRLLQLGPVVAHAVGIAHLTDIFQVFVAVQVMLRAFVEGSSVEAFQSLPCML